MTTILKTGAPVSAGQITDLGMAHDHVLFNTQWVGRFNTPITAMLLMNLAKASATRNKEVLMIKRTGIQQKFTAIADFTVTAIGTIMPNVHFDTYCGAGVDAFLREGLGFTVDGYSNTIALSGVLRHSELTIVSGDPVAGWNVRVDYTSAAGTYDFNSDMGITAFTIVGSEPYYGQAPASLSLTPEYYKNFHQYFRVPFTYEHKAVAQDNWFLDIPGNLRTEAHGFLLRQMNDALLRNVRPMKDNASDTSAAIGSETALYGTAAKRTRMGGLPWVIGYGVDANNVEGHVWNTKRWAAQTSFDMALADPTAAEARAFLGDLFTWGSMFDIDPRPYLGLIPTNFREMIRRVLVNSGYNQSYSEGTIKLPQTDLFYQELDLHNIRIRMVVDQSMDSSDPHGYVRYSAGLGGATVALSQVFAGNMMPTFCPTDLGISYAIDDAPNGNGIRVPNVYPIDPVRNPNGTEMEETTEFTLVGDNRHKMGIFHQRVGNV